MIWKVVVVAAAIYKIIHPSIVLLDYSRPLFLSHPGERCGKEINKVKRGTANVQNIKKSKENRNEKRAEK